MIRVTTGSRLHFGLFALPSRAGESSSPAGEPRRHFGGVGLMIERPGIELSLTPASSWSAGGPLAERALKFAKHCTSVPCRLEFDRCAPEHKGLGTGTQLALAVGLALSMQGVAAVGLAQRLGRGQRSALGVHGFAQGGFLVEGGKGSTTALSPLVARARFPESWRIVLVVPKDAEGVHGEPESEAFAQLAQHPANLSDPLCRLTLLGMLPALHEQDMPAFGEALYEFNRRVGEMFRPAQGGVYACPQTEALVDYLRKEGIRGAGQSSWGPTTFAVTSQDRAEHLAASLRDRFGLQSDEVIVTTARNEGAKRDPRA